MHRILLKCHKIDVICNTFDEFSTIYGVISGIIVTFVNIS